MPNDCYEYNNDFVPGTRIRSQDLDEQFQAIESAFDQVCPAVRNSVQLPNPPDTNPPSEDSVVVVDTNGDADYVVIEELVNAVPDGGTEGQVLTKLSDTDGDIAWQDSASGGAGSSGRAARYFAISITPGNEFLLELNAINLFNNTGPFVTNNTRWDSGTNINDLVDSVAFINFATPSNIFLNGGLPGATDRLLSGNTSDPGTEPSPANVTAPAGEELIIVFDFGEGNAVVVDGFQIAMSASPGNDTFIDAYPTNDGEAPIAIPGGESFIAYPFTVGDSDLPAQEFSLDFTCRAQRATIDPDNLETYPKIDGGAYWNFDYAVKNATFSPVNKGYYFVEGNNLDDFTITLPAGTEGDRIGFAVANHGSAVVGADEGPGGINSGTVAVTIEDSGNNNVFFVGRKPSAVFPSNLADAGNACVNVELIYVNGDWNILNALISFYVE